jgi:hypothetical protein
MPRASVGMGPVRVGSGCCVAFVVPPIVVAAMLFVLGGTALAAKQYVLKHPKHEHCKAHYVKKTKTIKTRVHGRTERLHETVCVYVAPKMTPSTTPSTTSTPAPAVGIPTITSPTVTSTPTPEPFATTTTLSATLDTTSGCTNNGNNENEFCEYIIAYSTVNNHGEAPPDTSSVLESRVPPAVITEPAAVPSGSLLRVSWFINLHNECVIYATINHTNTEAVDGTCERVNPRIVLTANYAHPAMGWLPSQSEPVTIR